MKLRDIFTEAIKDADNLVLLYDSLLTANQRQIRPEWRDRFFKAQLVSWPKKGGLWRSKNDKVLIIGNDKAQLSHLSFSADCLSVFLRAALVLAMAAVDKVLHEAVSKNFASLAKSGELDDLVQIKLSKVYQISQAARVRKGKGGKVKSRPGHKIKAEVLARIYSDCYLSTRKLQEICAACGEKSIFAQFAVSRQRNERAQQLQDRWSQIYQRRNRIAHECNIVRKAKTGRIRFHELEPRQIKNDIIFTKRFGRFIARGLN